MYNYTVTIRLLRGSVVEWSNASVRISWCQWDQGLNPIHSSFFCGKKKKNVHIQTCEKQRKTYFSGNHLVSPILKSIVTFIASPFIQLFGHVRSRLSLNRTYLKVILSGNKTRDFEWLSTLIWHKLQPVHPPQLVNNLDYYKFIFELRHSGYRLQMYAGIK